MAKATIRTIKRLVTKEVEVQDDITLELSKAEALALKLALGRIAGGPNSGNYYTDEIYQELASAGIPFTKSAPFFESEQVDVFVQGSRATIAQAAARL